MQQERTKKGKKISGPPIGQKLREIRESKGLTRKKLSESTGLTVQAITQVETGRRQPAFQTLVALAQALNISLDAIVGLPSSKYTHDILQDTGILAMAEKTARLPKELQEEVKGFVDFVWEKKMRKRKGKKR